MQAKCEDCGMSMTLDETTVNLSASSKHELCLSIVCSNPDCKYRHAIYDCDEGWNVVDVDQDIEMAKKEAKPYVPKSHNCDTCKVAPVCANRGSRSMDEIEAGEIVVSCTHCGQDHEISDSFFREMADGVDLICTVCGKGFGV